MQSQRRVWDRYWWVQSCTQRHN